MIRDLPEEHRDLFTRLYNRDNLIIVPVTHGRKKLSEDSCSACNVGLPVGVVAQIRSADSVMNCSNCRRFLFYPENRARGSRPRSQGRAPPPSASRVSRPSGSCCRTSTRTAWRSFSSC
ncbi:MAG: C4-type zinc ribbon domain-containing protein [Kiritimatiellia bacterium]